MALPDPSPTRPARRRRVLRRAAAVGLAALSTGLLWIVARPLLGLDMRVPDGPDATRMQYVDLPTVVISTIVIALAGWAVLALLERFSGAASRIWRRLALGVFTLSLFGPLVGQNVQAATRVALVAMHVAVAVVLIRLLPERAAGPQSANGAMHRDAPDGDVTEGSDRGPGAVASRVSGAQDRR